MSQQKFCRDILYYYPLFVDDVFLIGLIVIKKNNLCFVYNSFMIVITGVSHLNKNSARWKFKLSWVVYTLWSKIKKKNFYINSWQPTIKKNTSAICWTILNEFIKSRTFGSQNQITFSLFTAYLETQKKWHLLLLLKLLNQLF